MEQTMSRNDIICRHFQIRKFNRKHMVPAVTMTINANVTGILKLKEALNSQSAEGPHITVTHIVMKTVADALVHYPLLYGFFDGKNIIENKELILNIPVDIESHVEYITIYNPAAKSLVQISAECQEEISRIQEGSGKFIGFLKGLNDMPATQKMIYLLKPGGKTRFLREHYGNFPLSNFGSFHVNSGALALSQPIIAGLCIGLITQENNSSYMSLTLSFDHRAVDGAYAGKFLNSVRILLEQPASITIDRRS